jgi:hypothetical protein
MYQTVNSLTVPKFNLKLDLSLLYTYKLLFYIMTPISLAMKPYVLYF